MINKKNSPQDKNIIIREIKRKDVSSLLDAGYYFGKINLQKSLINKITQYAHLSPKITGLVAYSVVDKSTVGFLSLTKHTSSTQSIRYVFTSPDFRGRGIATKLINHAFSYAKRSGAKKIFLTSSPMGKTTELYKRLGFSKIGKNLAIWGRGRTKKITFEARDKLIPIGLELKENEDFLFKIYKEYMGKNWISFFGKDVTGLFYGYSQEFSNFYLRSVYVTKKGDSFVIIFKRPIRHVATAYLYVADDIRIKSLFGSLMNLFCSIGVIYSKITVFNVKNNECFNLLKRNNFFPYATIFMGRYLVDL